MNHAPQGSGSARPGEHNYSSLIGGGEMGERIRTFDWSKTPLGPISDWPQSLKTSLSICLASRFPIVMYWGPEYVVLYNDAYSAILGSKHPWALGQRCRDCWAEIWDTIGPMLAAREFVDPEARTLELSTMCGHGMVSASFARKMLDWVKENRRTPAEAAAKASQMEMRPFLSISAASSSNALTKNSGKTVS